MTLIPKVQRDTIESTSPRIIRHSHVFLIALFFHLLSIFHLAVSVRQSRTIKTRFIGIELVTPPQIAYATSECQSFPIKNSFKSSSSGSSEALWKQTFIFHNLLELTFLLGTTHKQLSAKQKHWRQLRESSHSQNGRELWRDLLAHVSPANFYTQTLQLHEL